MNPAFARCRITFGRVNASARKIASGCARLMSAMHHSQKRNGLVCGLSTRKIVTPCAIQNRKTSRSASHSAAPVAALEVERVDVLVLLRRVLRVLDRAVGPMLEPLRVLADPGMIGRRLERDVERDLESEVARGGDEAIEVVERAEPGSIAVWPPASEPMAHGLPGSPGAAVSALLRPLRCVVPIG